MVQMTLGSLTHVETAEDMWKIVAANPKCPIVVEFKEKRAKKWPFPVRFLCLTVTTPLKNLLATTSDVWYKGIGTAAFKSAVISTIHAMAAMALMMLGPAGT